MSALGDILGGSSSDDDDDFFGNASDEEVLREAQEEAIKNASSEASHREGEGETTRGRAGKRKGNPALEVKARSEQEQTRRGRNNRNGGSTQQSRDRDGSRDDRSGRAAARDAGEEDGEVYEAEPYKQTPSEIAALAPPPPIPYYGQAPRSKRPCRVDGHCVRPGCRFVHSGSADGSNGVPCSPAGTAGAYPPRGGGGGGAFSMGMAGMPGMPSSGLMMVPGHPPVLLPGAARPPLPSTMIPRGTSLPPSPSLCITVTGLWTTCWLVGLLAC